MQKLTLLLLLLSFLAKDISAQYTIGNASFSYLDPARNNRDVFGEVYFPTDATGNIATGEFPIIVFGHGFGIAISEYSVWWNELVPQGYIMIFPATEGGGIFNAPDHAEFGEDLSFLVNTYLSENSNINSPFFNKINGKSAIMGHSMGGGASFLGTATNPNVTTHVSLAAAETDPSAIAAAGLITIPSLVVAGGADCVVPPIDHQIPMYNALASSYKAYVEINGANHCNFGIASAFSFCVTGQTLAGSCGNTISQSSQHQQMFDITTPWFDYFLKMEVCAIGDFQEYMIDNDPTLHIHDEDGTPPSMMMAGTASNIMGTSADISWAAQSGVTNYTIQYRPVGTMTWMNTIALGTMTSLTGLTPNTDYEFSITANCTNGSSPMSPLGNFTTSNNCVVDLAFALPEHGIINELFEASNSISSTAIILSDANITYHAGVYIDLLPGFEVETAAEFLADIVPCVP